MYLAHHELESVVIIIIIMILTYEIGPECLAEAWSVHVDVGGMAEE